MSSKKVLVALTFGALMNVGGEAAEGDKQPSCWIDADYDMMSICFDGDGRFMMSVFYEGSPGEEDTVATPAVAIRAATTLSTLKPNGRAIHGASRTPAQGA